VRRMDPIFDEIAERADGKPLPPAAFGLWTFLWQIALDLAPVICAIEAEHPELTAFFKQEREWYQESKDGKGPMAVFAHE
jgi:hypothetical protein